MLVDVLGKEIPIDLARAIFRLDLFNVMKYCPILDDGLQDKYDELLNERSAQRESTMKALTLAILADSQTTVYDDTAENLVANETNSWLDTYISWKDEVGRQRIIPQSVAGRCARA